MLILCVDIRIPTFDSLLSSEFVYWDVDALPGRKQKVDQLQILLALESLFPHMHVPAPQILQFLIVTPRPNRPLELDFGDIDEPRSGDLVFHL